MRIYFMLSYDVIFKPQLLYQLLLRCPWQVVGVGEVRKNVVFSKIKSGKSKSNSVSALDFWGIKGMFYLGANILGRKILSAIPVPNYLRSRSTIKRVCGLFGIPYDLVDNVNDATYIAHLQSLSPDVIVSFQHQIFKDQILKLSQIACINCHPAKLPKYRGVKPIFWAMLNKDEEIGVTVHTMERNIDAGHIINQQCFRSIPYSTLMDNYVKAYSLSVDVILKSLEVCNVNKKLDELPVITSSSQYYREPNMDDLRRFKSTGLRII